MRSVVAAVSAGVFLLSAAITNAQQASPLPADPPQVSPEPVPPPSSSSTPLPAITLAEAEDRTEQEGEGQVLRCSGGAEGARGI
jgi:hypothetical protein